MSVLGQPYRIMYLSRGSRTGMTNVMAAVLRPDMTVVGIYPLVEAPGLFKGCYYYDYLSSVDDREGEYFSRVVSPTEGRQDIVRFSLYKAGDGTGAPASIPVQLTGYLEPVSLSGELSQDEEDVWGILQLSDLRGVVDDEVDLIGHFGNNYLTGIITSTSAIEGA